MKQLAEDIKPLESCRRDFPSLSRIHNGSPLVFLDGPGGSQVPQLVIDAISDYYRASNANSHGSFISSVETDEVINMARQKMAALLGAESPDTISFGQNMTTLNFSLSKALARYLGAGSEILITQLDHEANRGPWLHLEEMGLVIREIKLKPDGTLDYQDFQEKLSDRTGLVAIGYASNALGTVNDLERVRRWTKQTGTLLLVDAVHYVPHFKVDVSKLACDFLLCSAYKFYGPHVGVLYSRAGLLDELKTDRLVTQMPSAPDKIETGTLNHAALAGVAAAVDYLADFGTGQQLEERLSDAMSKIQDHEFKLYQRLYSSLSNLDGVEIYGPAPDPAWHTPTVSFTLDGYTPEKVCEALAIKNICAWDGHFYALKTIEALNLLDRGGVTRLGINMYTTQEEIDYTVKCISDLRS